MYEHVKLMLNDNSNYQRSVIERASRDLKLHEEELDRLHHVIAEAKAKLDENVRVLEILQKGVTNSKENN